MEFAEPLDKARNSLDTALTMFPETDSRYFQVLAYAFQLAAHRALQKADMLDARKRAEIRAGKTADNTGDSDRWEDLRDTQGGSTCPG